MGTEDVQVINVTPNAAIEQVMRCSINEADIYLLLDVKPGTLAAKQAVGRLLSSSSIKLYDGCPILAFSRSEMPEITWRNFYPPRPGSLYAELLTYRALFGGIVPGEHLDCFDELTAARALWENQEI